MRDPEGTIRGYLDFLEAGDGVKYRKKSEKWWARFLSNEPSIKLGVKKPVAVTIEKIERKVINQFKSAIKQLGKERTADLLNELIFDRLNFDIKPPQRITYCNDEEIIFDDFCDWSFIS